MSAETELQFDGWTVDRLSGAISRDGKSSRLTQQPLRILMELYDHAGTVVTRDQLVKALWPQGVVDYDNGLNVAMRKLRVALDDVGDVPRYIETLPRVGYRFIAARGQADPALPPGPAPRRRPLWLGLSIVGLSAALALGWWIGFESQRDASPRHVPSVRAQELYLEGIHARSRRDTNTNQLATEKFEAALREDPEYAEAWAALGDTVSAAVIRQMTPPSEGVPRARALAQKALALDDRLAAVHVSVGLILLDHDKDFTGAEREFRHAIELDSHYARAWHHLALVRAQLGQVEEGLTAMRRARELEPMTLLYAANYAVILNNARRYDETVAFLEPIVAANPKFDMARGILGRAHTALGNYPRALEILDAREEIGVMQADLGVLYARMGRREDALREVARLEARGREGFATAYDVALVRTLLGDLDGGCEWLARAVTEKSFLVNWIRLDPRLDPIRGRQCFADAERRLFTAR